MNNDFLQDMLDDRRSMHVALADMLVKYRQDPTNPLAHTINELIREEIELKARAEHPDAALTAISFLDI